MRWFTLFAVIVLFAFVPTSASQDAPTRSFAMGFTPFPYEVSIEAVDYTYARIAADADLIAHHFDNGVPWVEALNGQPYSDNLMNDWYWRRLRTPEDHQVYLSVTPINFQRDGLALYRGEQDDMLLPSPFDGYTFDHPDVETAFLNYVEEAVAYFEPDYLVFGIEVNLLMKVRPDLWDGYVRLHRRVYQQLKEAHPTLPIMVSMTGIDLLEGYTDVDHDQQMQAFNDLIDYTDYFALSVYPYMTAYMTNALPDAMFDQLAALTDKPIAISETGYPAQSFAIDAGNGTQIEFISDEAKQAAYIDLLLSEADEYQFRYIINFILRDYDSVWEMLGARNDLTIAWRDTGLYAEDGDERPALEAWRTALARPLSPPQ